MQKDQIKESFSVLEERLERLETIALQNEVSSVSGTADFDFVEARALHEIREQFQFLQNTVFDEVLRQKSIASQDLLNRVCKFLIEEAQKSGQDLSISCFGSGQISMSMVESAMAAILACARVSWRSASAMNSILRQQKYLFQPCSFYLEMHSREQGMHFSITDDGVGFKPETREEDFSLLRKYVAREGGWFSAAPARVYGNKIEFKIPSTQARTDSYLLSTGNFTLGIPASSVARILTPETLFEEVQQANELRAYSLDIDLGLSQKILVPESIELNMHAVVVAIADFQLLIICDKIQNSIPVRKIRDKDLLEENSWVHYLGVYQQNGMGHIVPFLEGHSLIDFHYKERREE